MASPEGSVIGELFYRIGYAAGQVESYVARRDETAEAPTRPRRRHRRSPERRPAETGVAELREQMEEALKDATEKWVVSRVLRPRPVHWGAVLFAGLASTALSDVVAYFTDPTRAHPLDEDPETLIARYAAGVASTSAYASLIYPRLPGSPLTRGAVYGLLDVVTEPEGGVLALGRELAPALRFPLKPFALPVNQDAGPLARMAFGLGLGLFYRASSG